MPPIRLIGEVTDRGSRGPSRGMYALQSALRGMASWLRIGGMMKQGEIPWFWSYENRRSAIAFTELGLPFIMGPNLLFCRSSFPGFGVGEDILMNASSCVLQFTESDWYAELLRKHCVGNKAPIALWSYPIEPQPHGPRPAEYHVLVYSKNFPFEAHFFADVMARWPRSIMVRYGEYDREEMIETARRSQCCLYLSEDDRGPLALAEIMLAGCPAVGVPRGAPWIVNGISGVKIDDWSKTENAINEAMDLDRNEVREWAVDRFATEKTVQAVLSALEPIANAT